MIINFLPVRMDEELLADREGDLLYLNGEVFDFSPLPEAATLPQEAINSKWFAGPVERINGELVLTVVLPHGPNAPEATRFPKPIIMTEDGSIDLPLYDLVADPEIALDPEEAAEQEPEQ